MKKAISSLGLALLLVAVPQFVSADETSSQEMIQEQNDIEMTESKITEEVENQELEVPIEEMQETSETEETQEN